MQKNVSNTVVLCLQVEAHPYWPNTALIKAARAAGVHVTAYSPLGSPDSATLLNQVSAQPPTGPATSAADRTAANNVTVAPQLLQHPLVLNTARRLDKSAAQVSAVSGWSWYSKHHSAA